MKAPHRRFVDEYLVDLNATAAAIRAGYSAKSARSTSSKLLDRDDIQAAVKSAMDARSARVELNADTVLRELGRLALSDLRDVGSWGPGGFVLKDSSEITEHAARAISSVATKTRTARGNDGKEWTTVEVKVTLHDKGNAVRDAMRHLGLLGMEEEKPESADSRVRKLREAMDAMDASVGVSPEQSSSEP